MGCGFSFLGSGGSKARICLNMVVVLITLTMLDLPVF